MKKAKGLAVVAGLAAGLAGALPAQAAVYEADSGHSFARFSYDHFGFSRQESRFDKASGKVEFDAAKRTAAVDMAVDIASVNTGSKLFDEHIQGEDFLSSKAYPKARFVSTKVVFDGAVPASVEGTLTIKGVSKPVVFKVLRFKEAPHPMTKKPAIGADAEATIKRSDFGAGKYAPAVGDEVTIRLTFEGQAQ